MDTVYSHNGTLYGNKNKKTHTINEWILQVNQHWVKF